MKCEIIESEKNTRLPDVGEYYVNTASGRILRRVLDSDGEKILGRLNLGYTFYAQEVLTGRFVMGGRSSDRALLEQVEPAKFKVKE